MEIISKSKSLGQCLSKWREELIGTNFPYIIVHGKHIKVSIFLEAENELYEKENRVKE
jgi:hypothetical protein